MKTKELIRRLEFIGYGVKESEHVGEVRVFHNGVLCATVSTRYFLSIDTQNRNFYKLDKYEQEELYGILEKYARTPLEDREEEEKYYYHFPYYIAATQIESPAYVCRNHTFRQFAGELILDTSSFDVVKKNDAFHFTDKEVEAMADVDKSLIALCVPERVE